MKKTLASTIVLLLSVAIWPASAQDTASPTRRFTPLRIQVVLTRYEGDKKTSSMPNSLWVNVSDEPKAESSSLLSIGVQVPIHVVANTVPTIAYKDVGNKISCFITPQADGRFQLKLFIVQSSVDNSARGGQSGGSTNPILRSVENTFTMVLRDGQTAQSTSATDPISGEVLKIDVTLNVVK